MTTKEAIAYVKNMGHEADNWTAPRAVEMVIDALRASQKALKLMALNDARIIGKLKQDVRDAQKREREVFKRLSMICCRYYSKVCGCCYDQWGDSCCMKKCPLLKQKKEIK
jgi:hypothetical protein